MSPDDKERPRDSVARAGEGPMKRARKRIALGILRMGARPYKMLDKWGNRTLGYEIGEHTYGVPRVVFPDGKLKIGKFCSLAWDVTIFLGGNHRVDWIATYPFPSSHDKWPNARGVEKFLTTRGDVIIGNDVWIGSDVIILSGVTIGDGAVIGVGSVVTSDVPPYSIVGGNPAKVIRKRFSDEAIEKLLKIKWWDWPSEKINENVHILMSGDIDKLEQIS